MPTGKRIPGKEVIEKVKGSSINAKKLLFDLPYKRHQQFALQTGIQSGPYGRKIKKPAANTIGVLVHTLHSHFIRSALTGMEEVADQLGYEIMIMHSQENSKREAANAQMLFDLQVAGLIASLSLDTRSLDHFNIFTSESIPVVFFDRVDTRGNNRSVVIDNVGTGYAATHHLIQQGCKRIAIITSCLERNVYADRFTGFRNALHDGGIAFNDDLLFVNDITESAGVEAAKQILKMRNKPDGLFITNDVVAAACMRSLMENGVQVPDDIAIVGFNNDPVCKLTVPTITTVDYPGIEMGRTAAKQLINMMAKRDCPAIETLPAALVIRQSSLKNAVFGS
ncbi:LacI family DNA-binding transcriptional regulator [Longitalea arenae]|uniref:LacI family DNA-binding transcriptional regulator n=1 Tax=Longitalea arenae TaxID=2812558 RepID=UPI001968554D|nr:substrate-binding domain-containing protein [Longitalea arenae]